MDFRYDHESGFTHLTPSRLNTEDYENSEEFNQRETDLYNKLAANLPRSQINYVKEALPHVVLIGIRPRLEVYKFMREIGILEPLAIEIPPPRVVDVQLPDTTA